MGRAAAKEEGRVVCGMQPVREAIRVHGSRIARLCLQHGEAKRLEAVERLARDQGVTQVERLPPLQLDRMTGGVVHQGAVAWAPPLELVPAASLYVRPTLLALALDRIQDPHNFGAAVRSAVAVAGATVIWGEHAAAPLTPATFRASAGAIEHAELCQVSSLRGTLVEAAAARIQVAGLDAQADRQLSQLDLTRPTILVVGSEGEGLARGVRRACTDLVQLFAPHAIDSVNASVAAAIALYEAATQRARAGSAR